MRKGKGLQVTILICVLGLLSLGSSTETTLLVFSRFAVQSLLLWQFLQGSYFKQTVMHLIDPHG